MEHFTQQKPIHLKGFSTIFVYFSYIVMIQLHQFAGFFGGVKCWSYADQQWSTCWFGRSCEAYWVDNCGRLLLSLCRFTGKKRRKRMAFFKRFQGWGHRMLFFSGKGSFIASYCSDYINMVCVFTILTWRSMITRLHHCLNMNDGFTNLEWFFTRIPLIAHSHLQGFLIAISKNYPWNIMKPFPDPGFLILPYHDMFVFFLVFDGPFISKKNTSLLKACCWKLTKAFS